MKKNSVKKKDLRYTKSDLRKVVKALRSGDYKQTLYQMCRVMANGEDCFCAEGVVADVLGDGHWELPDGSRTWLYFPAREEGGDGRLGCGASLPGEMKHALFERGISDLAGRNDSGWCFSKIADYIEQKAGL